ncbi:MAG: SIR2 family protein [Candidatus Thorarchaeota archaeon]|jgi:ATP/maltotriose-dependent transcriptional regulator MalT
MTQIDIDRLVSILSVEGCRYALFVGAGISVSAGVPLAITDLPNLPSIASEAKKHIFISNNPNLMPSKKNIKKWFKRKGYLEESNNIYGDILELLSTSKRGRMKFLRQFFVGKQPSLIHLYIAEMVKRKIIEIILTTNFDDLLEKALDRLSIEHITYAFSQSLRDFKLLDNYPKLIKFHGDYRYSYIKNTNKETIELEKIKIAAFEHIMHEYGLIFVGYGGNDKSIMNPILNCISKEDYLPYGIVWVKRKGSSHSEFFERLIRRNPKKIYLLEISDAENLFETLYRKMVPLFERAQDSRDLIFFRPEEKIQIHYYPKDLERITSFINRENEIKQLMEISQENAILIKGVAGSGKTYLAIKFHQELKKIRKITYWHSFPSSGKHSLNQLLFELAGFAKNELKDDRLSVYLQDVPLIQENEEIAIRMLIDILKKKECFLFFDDFHNVKNKPIINFFERLYFSICNSKLVLISRKEPSFVYRKKIPTLKETCVEGFSPANIKLYFKKRGVEISSKLSQLIYCNFSGIPFSLDLIYGYIKNCGIESSEVEDFIAEIKEDVEEQLIAKIYKSLTPNERKVLRVMSVWRENVRFKDLCYVLEFSRKRLRSILKELHKKVLVKYNGRNFSVHDLIKEYAYNRNRSLQRLHSKIGEKYFKESFLPKSLLEALYHFVRAKKFELVSKIILDKSDQIIRFGSVSYLLELLEEIESTKISKKTWISLQFIKIRVCENLGEYHIAKGILFAIENLIKKNMFHIAKFRYYMGRIEYFLGNIDSAKDNYIETLKEFKKMKDKGTQPLFFDEVGLSDELVLSQLGRILFIQGYLISALSIYDKVLTGHREKGDIKGINKTIHRIAMIYSDWGEYEKAEKLFNQVLIISNEIGDKKRISYVKYRLAEIALQRNDMKNALKYHLESKQIKEEIGHKRGLIFSYRALANISCKNGKYEQALESINTSIGIANDLSELKELNKSYITKSEILITIGREKEAFFLLEKSQKTFEILNLPRELIRVYTLLSSLKILDPELRKGYIKKSKRLETILNSPAVNKELTENFLQNCGIRL